MKDPSKPENGGESNGGVRRGKFSPQVGEMSALELFRQLACKIIFETLKMMQWKVHLDQKIEGNPMVVSDAENFHPQMGEKVALELQTAGL